jgi:hypothetical protein
MGAPFEQFTVRRHWFFWLKFVVDVERLGPFVSDDADKDAIADGRRFIEDAINEKLAALAREKEKP